MSELEKWLDTVTCEKPWTLDDSIAFRQLVKERAGVKAAEVYYVDGRDGQQVRVRVEVDGVTIRRTYDVR